MTPRQLRDAANRPWEAPSVFYLPEGTYTPEQARAAFVPVKAVPGPGEYHFPVDCPANGDCMYCLNPRWREHP